MITEQITHKDFNGNTTNTILHFNLNRIEVADMLDLLPRFEKIQSVFEEDERELTTEEIKELLDLVKIIMKHSYGIRSDDGQRFIKDVPVGEGNIWLEFTQTNAYDAFLFSLFEQPAKADSWMKGLMPSQLIEEAKAQAVTSRPPTQDHQQKQQPARDRMAVVELPQASTEGEPSVVPDPDELAAFRAWQESQKGES